MYFKALAQRKGNAFAYGSVAVLDWKETFLHLFICRNEYLKDLFWGVGMMGELEEIGKNKMLGLAS